MYVVKIGGLPVATLVSASAIERVGTIDLDMVKVKLVREHGWTEARADSVEIAYRRFLALCMMFPDKQIAPTPDIDDMWHQHILDTRAYADDTKRVFGEFLHHHPYAGMNGEDDAQALATAYAETAELYRSHFADVYGDGETTTCSSVRTCSSSPNKRDN